MKTRTIVIVGAILLAALSRTLPHPANFGPITAMALFGAATLRDRRLALALPLLALFISDAVIEVLFRQGWMNSWGFYWGMWGTYGAVLFIGLIGLLLRRHRTVPAILGGTLAGSVLFFLVTNFATWAEGFLYPPTMAGLVDCYIKGLEFFRFTLLGDLAYVTVLFGGFALAMKWVPALSDPVFIPAAANEQG